jgi:hypothetical protein
MSEMAEARAAMPAARLETGELEGLFAEVIRRPGLTDFLQREYRVTVAGPTTLAALLNERAHAELGQFDDAWRSIADAMTISERTKEQFCEADIYRTAGEIALMRPEPDMVKAEGYFEHALAIARSQQAKSWELRAAMSMARLWRDQGKRQQGHDLLAPGLRLVHRGL